MTCTTLTSHESRPPRSAHCIPCICRFTRLASLAMTRRLRSPTTVSLTNINFSTFCASVGAWDPEMKNGITAVFRIDSKVQYITAGEKT